MEEVSQGLHEVMGDTQVRSARGVAAVGDVIVVVVVVVVWRGARRRTQPKTRGLFSR